jgi:hypothetical protein
MNESSESLTHAAHYSRLGTVGPTVVELSNESTGTVCSLVLDLVSCFQGGAVCLH